MIIIWVFFLLIIFGVSLIFPIVYQITKKRIFLKLFLFYWITIILLYFSVLVLDFINSPTNVSKSDIVGKYEINKSMFKGKNADWQYQHFSFEITPNNDFIFFEYHDNGSLKSVHKGKAQYIEGYASPHLKINNLKPNHQVVDQEPLLVRSNWGFYYVFNSKKFGNMFFKKKQEGVFSKFEN